MNIAKSKKRLIAYIFALVATVMGFILRIAITHFVGSGLPTYVTFYPFIMFVAIFGGLGPGLLTTIISAFSIDYFFLPPRGVLTFQNPADAAGMALFIIMGILMSVAAEIYNRRHEKQEKALRLANSHNRSLLEASLDPLVTISREGKITDANEAAVKVRGIPREKLIGTDFSSYFTEPEKAREGYEQVFAKGFVSDYPLTIRHKDGKLTDVLYNATVYKDTRGNILGVFAAARDITELNYLQNKLILSEKFAALGKLAGYVSHELRNPLGVMKNVLYYLDMLGVGKDNAEVKENLDILSTEIEKSDKIINDLLDFSRIKKPNLQPANINTIVDEILDRLTIGANIKVVKELQSGMPDIKLDALHIHQVFYNIAKNAIEAMDKGGTLKIRATLEGNFAVISFGDTGVGIPKENLDKIFEPLFSTKLKGSGLGLALCNSLIAGHGGKIEVESETGKGTTVVVRLPAKRG